MERSRDDRGLDNSVSRQRVGGSRTRSGRGPDSAGRGRGGVRGALDDGPARDRRDARSTRHHAIAAAYDRFGGAKSPSLRGSK